MWPDSVGAEGDVGQEKRPSTSSEVATFDDRLAAAIRGAPVPANLNINKSSKVHVGPKVTTVTQNIQHNDVVKDLPLPQYLWSVVKNTTKAERLSCGIALLLVIICNLLIIYFTVIARSSDSDVAPHEWMISREMWLARPFNHTEFTASFEPLRLVVVQHTVSAECNTFNMCAAEMRQMQTYYLDGLGWNIPYNFMVGNDGRVYEGRGWGIVGAHTRGFNWCSVGIGFVGDYREEKEGHTVVTPAQLNRTLLLLDEGVRRGILEPHYLVVGARDLTSTASPGSNLYNAIRKWKHYDHENRFFGMNCTEIHEAPFNVHT